MNKNTDVKEKPLRDLLALDRTRLANQRTFLSFVRTSLYFFAMGLTVMEIESFAKIKFIAVPLFIMGMILFPTGVYSYIREKRKIKGIEKNLLE